MRLSHRELVLGMATLGVGVLAGTVLLVRPKLRQWRELWAEQSEVRRQIELDERIVAERGRWGAQLAEMSKLLPVHPAGKKTDVHWLETMDGLAKTHGLTVLKRQAGEEKRVGDVYELPIDCNEWEGTLDSLVHFLFALQSEGAMLDIRQLMIRPKGDGLLRGRFTLYCAYTREGAARAQPPAAGAPGAERNGDVRGTHKPE